MGWSGGTYTRAGAVHTGSEVWQDSAGDGDAVISSSEHDTHDQDLADGINACLHKGGQNAWTGDLDAGNSYHITNLVAGSATGDSIRWDEAVKTSSALTLNGTILEINYNDGTKSTLDIASVGSAGEVTLSGNQTITGKKTFTTNPTVMFFAKHNGAFYSKVNELTSGATVAIDITSDSWFFLDNNQAMTLNFTVPTAASDTDLGADFVSKAAVCVRNSSGHGALTLAVVGGADDTEEIGGRPTTTGEMYIIQVTAVVLDGTTRYVWFTYVTA